MRHGVRHRRDRMRAARSAAWRRSCLAADEAEPAPTVQLRAGRWPRSCQPADYKGKSRCWSTSGPAGALRARRHFRRLTRSTGNTSRAVSRCWPSTLTSGAMMPICFSRDHPHLMTVLFDPKGASPLGVRRPGHAEFVPDRQGRQHPVHAHGLLRERARQLPARNRPTALGATDAMTHITSTRARLHHRHRGRALRALVGGCATVQPWERGPPRRPVAWCSTQTEAWSPT